MTASFPLRKAAPWQHVAALVRSVPPVPRAAFVATLVCAAVAMATWQGEWLTRGIEAAAADARAPLARGLVPAAVPAVARARSRCDGCAVVKSIRRLDTAPGSPESHELVLVLRDGSTHVSTSISAARWQVGDRVLLIGADTQED